MGFFGKSKKKKAASKTAASTKKVTSKTTPESSPMKATEPTTPPTVEAEEPITAPSDTDNDPTTPQKKNRTRISVTTPPTQPATDKKEDPGLSASNTSEGATSPNETADVSEETVEGTGDENGVDTTNDTTTVGGDATLTVDGSSEETVTKTLLNSFNTCDVIPEQLQAYLSKSWLAKPAESELETKQEKPKVSYYSEAFAGKFLEELSNVGFNLVYHQPAVLLEDENSEWQGRSAAMTFRPGICNALEIIQPALEWSTTGGGKDTEVLTRSVELVDIHSIAISSADDMRDDLEAGDAEEVLCFFTLATKSGDVHVFESLDMQESNRLVLGIKNIVGRFSNLTVAGDSRVLLEFFDNSADPRELRLTPKRAVFQVSNSFLG